MLNNKKFTALLACSDFKVAESQLALHTISDAHVTTYRRSDNNGVRWQLEVAQNGQVNLRKFLHNRMTGYARSSLNELENLFTDFKLFKKKLPPDSELIEKSSKQDLLSV